MAKRIVSVTKSSISIPKQRCKHGLIVDYCAHCTPRRVETVVPYCVPIKKEDENGDETIRFLKRKRIVVTYRKN